MFMSAVISSVVVSGMLVGPPATKAEPVTDVYHGESIVDPFRWLEPLEADSDAVRQWTDAQLGYTRGILDHLPGRAQLEARLATLMELPSVGAPVAGGRWYFNTVRAGDQNQPTLFVRDGADGDPRPILDPNTLDPDGLTSLDWFEPSHDGRLLAFGVSHAGDENSVAHVLDVERGTWLADEISGKVNGVYWMPDASGFFYGDLADLDNPYSGRVRFHRLGTHAREDRTLFEQYKTGPLATTWGPGASVSRDGRWMILTYWTSTRSNDLWCIDLDRWFRTGEFVQTEIITGDASTSDGPVSGDTLFMLTTSGTPNGSVHAVDLTHPSRDAWRTIVPERADATIDSIHLARGRLVVRYVSRASTRLERFRLDGTPVGPIELPGIGTASIVTNPDRTEAFVSYTSYNDPSSIWRADLETGALALWEQTEVPFDPSTLTVDQVEYPSKDGTPVTMFIVHRTDVRLDGANPTILYGYGGFNISITPSFNPARIPWLEQGGVYAFANLRGGGEYGEAWHQDGMLGRKQHTFDDFIAAAEYLVARRYTSPEHLAILGGSNGGLLTGAVMVQRPDLFAAVVSAVPLLDMLRYQDFLMARYWVPEYGSSEDPAQYQWLRAYSPYQNIRPGTKYPATLVTAGENDSRVHPMHARKMVAGLQQATTADPDADPILLWVDRSGGHGQGKPLSARVREAADLYSFIMWQTGMYPE
ncbi:MAG: S9 family peptidase [Phycisphaerales bacterium]|nr:S9 family peptidase [Phycisphaerales bacterium]